MGQVQEFFLHLSHSLGLTVKLLYSTSRRIHGMSGVRQGGAMRSAAFFATSAASSGAMPMSAMRSSSTSFS